MSLTSAVSDLFKSIYGLFAAFFEAIFSIFRGAFNTVQSFLVGILHLVQNLIAQVVHLTGGVGKFIISNFVALAVGGLLVFAYVRFTAQGRVAATKKTQ